MADYLMPLEDRVHLFFKEEIAFTVEDVSKRFPDEHVRSIYRAINKLVETNRIRQVRAAGRKKVYTASGSSSLPMIKTNQGNTVPVSALINAMPNMYDENGRFRQTEMDEVFIVMCQLFVIAQDPTKADFLAAHKKLTELREFFVRMADNVNNVLRHPGMQGDLEAFKNTFCSDKDPATPTPQQLLNFRTWLAKRLS